MALVPQKWKNSCVPELKLARTALTIGFSNIGPLEGIEVLSKKGFQPLWYWMQWGLQSLRHFIRIDNEHLPSLPSLVERTWGIPGMKCICPSRNNVHYIRVNRTRRQDLKVSSRTSNPGFYPIQSRPIALDQFLELVTRNVIRFTQQAYLEKEHKC